jgi:hypothetical protein
MRRGDLSASLPKESLLKVDKDCFVNAKLNRQYLETIVDTCRKHGLKVVWIKSIQTQHGMHFYIKVDPPVDAHTANSLQYLLGDDAKRVAFNRARIESGLVEWNKLFEAVGRKPSTPYTGTRTKAET